MTDDGGQRAPAKVVDLNRAARCRICGGQLDPRVYGSDDAHDRCKLLQPIGPVPEPPRSEDAE